MQKGASGIKPYHWFKPVCLPHRDTLVFSVFGSLNLSNIILNIGLLFDKYRYKLSTCVHLGIHVCAQNFHTPVLITTCIALVQILVAK